MSAYLDYETYITMTPNPVTEEEFNAQISWACNYLDLVTHYRSQEVSDTSYKYVQMQMCIAALIGQNVENVAQHEHAGLKSASNDGYSETYADAEISAENDDTKLRGLCFRYLSGTGLLSALEAV